MHLDVKACAHNCWLEQKSIGGLWNGNNCTCILNDERGVINTLFFTSSSIKVC